ncbi:MAG TPA: S41 family peptidase [Paludibacteraceae bacterium]|nr:S41 family peptidase [Paludibacteraceae bacterium]
MKKSVVYMPIFFALAVIVGIFIGKTLSDKKSSHQVKQETVVKGDKINALLNLISAKYVDSLSSDSLIEKAIPKIVSNLDPHSVYIPASELQTVNEELEGSFSGIGVQFNIQRDTVMIVSVIGGGPSEKLGVLPGDRIVTVNDSTFVGKEITNEKVVNKLRGPKGTKVKVGIKRNGAKDLLSFEIVRGDIPVNSIDAYYKIGSDIGYVKVNRFGGSTYEEFFKALMAMKESGAEKFIVDLRGNSGGYLDAAISMINEFLGKGDMIVYTEGNANSRTDAIADGNGRFKTNRVMVLIDEWSASASEIFAGAIQDNDRGLIVGRRSFGKGVVQQQFPLLDGSALRLTIARYYTPSGRCIQKPYGNGEESYESDIYNRYIHGELDAKDSIHVNKSDTTIYRTKHGRVVYGGGGIMPDVFVPRDTTGMTSYFNKVNNSGMIYEYSFNYTDSNREKLKSYKNLNELEAFLDGEDLVSNFVVFAEGKGVKRNPNLLNKSRSLIKMKIKTYIIRNMLGDTAFYQILNRDDVTLKAALFQLSSKNEIK